MLGVCTSGVTVGSLPAGKVGSLLSDTSLTALPFGAVPLAVAVLVTLPVLMSAWVIVYVPVAVPIAPGNKIAGVTLIVDGDNLISVTVNPFTVVFPVLVTVKV